MRQTNANNDLSLVVKLAEGAYLNFRSDLERLTHGQNEKLSDFLTSVVNRPEYRSRPLIREIRTLPYYQPLKRNVYPVGMDRNYSE